MSEILFSRSLITFITVFCIDFDPMNWGYLIIQVRFLLKLHRQPIMQYSSLSTLFFPYFSIYSFLISHLGLNLLSSIELLVRTGLYLGSRNPKIGCVDKWIHYIRIYYPGLDGILIMRIHCYILLPIFFI